MTTQLKLFEAPEERRVEPLHEAGPCSVPDPLTDCTSRRLGQATFANLVAQLLQAGGQLALVPLLLGQWGALRYGDWLSLSAAAAGLSSLDLGLQSYASNRIASAWARGEVAECARLLHSALAFAVLVAVLAAALLGLLLFGAQEAQQFGSLFELERTTAADALVTLTLLSLAVLGTLPMGVLSGTWRGLGRLAAATWIGNAQRAVLIVGTVLGVSLGWNLVALAAFQLVLALGTVLVLGLGLLRIAPELELRPHLPRANLALARSFFWPSLGFFLVQLAMALVLQGSTLMVGHVAGAAAVVLFATHRTLANMVRQASSALSNALWPELTRLHALERFGELRALHRSALKLLCAACTCAAILLHVSGADLMQLWTGGRLEYAPRLMDALLLLLMLETPWLASAYVLLATNQQRGLSIAWMLSSLVGLGCAWLLSEHLGLVGVALGLSAGQVVSVGWWVPLRVSRLIGESALRLSCELAWRTLAHLALCLPLALGLQAWTTSLGPLARLLLVGSALLLTATLALPKIWFDQRERSQIYRGLRSLLRRAPLVSPLPDCT